MKKQREMPVCPPALIVIQVVRNFKKSTLPARIRYTLPEAEASNLMPSGRARVSLSMMNAERKLAT